MGGETPVQEVELLKVNREIDFNLTFAYIREVFCLQFMHNSVKFNANSGKGPVTPAFE